MNLTKLAEHKLFSATTMTDALRYFDYQPSLLGALDIFQTVASSTIDVAIEREQNIIKIVPCTPRGGPATTPNRGVRDIRFVSTPRIAIESTITAASFQDVRKLGEWNALDSLFDKVANEEEQLIKSIELTKENMRLGAVQGMVYDADGSVLYDWFKLWNVKRPQPIDFNLSDPDANISITCSDVIRQMQRASKGAFIDGGSVIGLCGDAFYDALRTHPKVENIYLNTQNALALGGTFGVSNIATINGKTYPTFTYGGIQFINYRSVDDYDDKALRGTQKAIGIKSNECQFIPQGADGVFQQTFAPAESFEFVNQQGLPLYAELIPDRDSNAWIKVRIASYPLFICTNPAMLLRGVNATSQRRANKTL